MKKTRIVQIIREEIAKVLKEGSAKAKALAKQYSMSQLQRMLDDAFDEQESYAGQTPPGEEFDGNAFYNMDLGGYSMKDLDAAITIKRGDSGEMTYGDMLHKNYPDKYGPGGVELNEMAVNEMANFYSLDSKIQNSINPEDFKPKGQRNAAATLKKMETGNVTKGDIEKAFKGKDYKKGDIVFTKKDLQPVIDKYGIKLLGKTKDVTPKKEKKSKTKDTTPKSKKKSSVSKLEKKYYVDPEDGGPTNKELRDLAASGLGDESLSKLQSQERKKMLKVALKDLQKKGILDKSNKVLDREAYDKEFAKIKIDIANKVKNIK